MRDFCPDCVRWMVTRPPAMNRFVNVRPSLFIDKLVVPLVETRAVTGCSARCPITSHRFISLPAVPGRLGD
ncbi:MAG: hypothetical protein QM690_19180 [Sphingobium sp.]